MSTRPPNLLLIMADQLRHDWLGFVGTPGVSTPYIDDLARRGMHFTHVVTNAAICAPTRIALASGVRPERLGAYGNEASLPAGMTTYYQRLRDHGYQVGVVGKLDLAKSASYNGRDGDRPQVYEWGFTHPLEAEGKMHAGGFEEHRPLGPYGFWLQERGLFERFCQDYDARLSQLFAPLHGGSYTGDGLYRDSVLPEHAFEDRWLGERAAEWIENISGDYPWHLFVSFVGPHDPFDPPTRLAEMFRGKEVLEPIRADLTGKPGYADPVQWQVDPEHVLIARRQYSASLASIDEQVGRLLDVLAERGFADNTIVMFTSDHGEMLGDHGLFQKSVPYESAMRIPLLVAGPTIRPGRSDALIELADVNPTLCELAGLEAQPDIDARSFAALIDSPGALPHREVVTCTQGHYQAIRTTRYKYVHNTRKHPRTRPTDIDELYDLEEDPTETRNLLLEDAGDLKSVIEEMRALHHDELGDVRRVRE